MKSKWLNIGVITAMLAMAVNASAALSFYAPYDDNLNLTVGSPSVPTEHGTVPLETGYDAYGMPGNSAEFDVPNDALRYGNVTNYLSGVGNSQVVGANSFRFLMKLDSVPNTRRIPLAVGNIHFNDQMFFRLFDAGDIDLALIAGGSYGGAVIPFGTMNWDLNTWYYVGGSVVSNAVNLYVRALTNGSSAVTASATFAPKTWGASASSSWSQGVLVGNRYDLIESVRGNIDEVQIYSGEFWNNSDFHYDFALVIPEPSTAALGLCGLAGLWMARRRKLARLPVALLAASLLLIPTRDASAVLSFYAPYDDDLNLTVGSPATITSSTGTVNLVTGFAAYGLPGMAGDFSDATNAVAYGNVSSYLSGTTPNSGIGSNSFRVLFKPNFSGPNVAQRRVIFGVGTLGQTDSFYIYNSDDLRGPAFILTSITDGFIFLNALSNFNWNSSTWYYLGASFDDQGASFYVRALTNDSVGVYQSGSFSTPPATWGGNMGSGTTNDGHWTLQVGRRAPIFGAGPEGANGLIDDVKVFSAERWGVSEFVYDFALVIPEPSSAMLLIGSASLVAMMRRKRQ